MYTHVYTCTYIYIYTYMYLYIHMYIYIHTHIYICIYNIYMKAHAYIYVQSRIHMCDMTQQQHRHRKLTETVGIVQAHGGGYLARTRYNCRRVRIADHFQNHLFKPYSYLYVCIHVYICIRVHIYK